VSRSPAPSVPQGTATGRSGGQHPSLPLSPWPPRPPLPSPRLAADPPLDEAEPAVEVPARRRRVPHPPGRRAPLWLAALIAGALAVALPTFVHSGPTDVASAATYGLGMSAEDGTGGIDDAGVRSSITEAEAQARLTELAASRAAREPQTVLPTHGVLTTCFCMRWGSMHWGIDLAAPLGTPILAATDGVVLRAGPASGYGNAIYIQDADGNVQIYGHMRYYSVKAGQVVHAGDQIAKVGSQGESTGPHLHFQLDHGSMTGKPFDPIPWFKQRGIAIPGA
jgi:murein DD-endopeptidase MepM/ murein hydrolase activator NlpD